MRISEITANTLVIPLAKPTGMSTRLVTERHYTIVRMRSHDGIEGRGFCYSGNKADHLVALAVRDLLRQVVIGRGPKCSVLDLGAYPRAGGWNNAKNQCYSI